MRRSPEPARGSLKIARLSPLDSWRVAWQGIRSRPQRSVLAALGITIGVAALVSLTAISESSQVALLRQMDSMGANLLVVESVRRPDGELVPLPRTAVDVIARQDEVAAVGGLQYVPAGVNAYRSDLVPEAETNGISVSAATPGFLAAVGGAVERGEWFDQSTRALPRVVLGSEAAARLGDPQIGDLLWVGNEWYSVLGVLEPIGLADKINTSVLLGDLWVQQRFDSDPLAVGPDVGDWTQIYVQSEPGAVAALGEILPLAANPSSPFVAAAPLSDLGGGREAADSMLRTLGMALGAIALAVGGVGIANTMVVSVMERRGEIGLRRALGARGGQIALQFLLEAAVLSLMGAVAGIVVGAGVAAVNSWVTGQPFLLPEQMIGLGLGVSVIVGAFAGLQPAAKAAKMAPVDALRAG